MKNQLSQILKSYSGELALLRPSSLADGTGGKQKQRLQAVFVVTAVVTLLMIVAGFVFGNKIELLSMAVIVVGLLAFHYRLQSQFLKQQEENQVKLHTMASTIEERNRELKRLIMIDPLTEVMNRRGFERVLQSEASRAKRNKTQNFALLIDCDDFKGVNEKFGHSVGDIVLQELSVRLQKAIRPSDHLARIGGDEFMILVTDANDDIALHVAERVRLAVAETPVNLTNGTTKITTSIGVASLGDTLMSIEEILAATNSGLKQSKRSGKNSVTFSKLDYETNDMTQFLERLRSGESLHCVYQPISKLDNQHVVGYEVQPRSIVGVFEQPEAFYKLAREHNLRTALDLRCLKLSLEAMERLPDESVCHIKLYPSTLLDIPVDSLAEMFASITRKICLSIGDHEFVAEPSCLKNHVDKLQELGVSIAIDRIGYGFSSLESLLILEPEYIKLDKGLVKKCETNELHQQFVKKLNKVVEQMNCKVVADGIDSREILKVMEDCGVNYGLGLYWGMPVAL